MADKVAHNLGRGLRRFFGWLWSQELMTLLGLLVIVGSVWVFIEIADEVLEGETRGFDRRILLALRDSRNPADPVGPAWVEEMVRDFTALGGMAVLLLLMALVSGALLLAGERRAMVFMLVAVLGGLLLSTALKSSFDRPRPDLVPHGTYVATSSFPSGHSMLSAVTYLTLGALLAGLHKRRAVKLYILISALLLTGVVGFSRVYLGVHWPTDVLAGWTAGAAWATLCYIVMRWLQRRGTVEPPTD